MNSSMYSFMNSVMTCMSSVMNPLVLVAAIVIAALLRERAHAARFPYTANFAGRNGCFRVTYTCDKHMYHECILYIYI